MLQKICLDSLKICFQYLGLANTLQLFFISKHLKAVIGSLPIKLINNIFQEQVVVNNQSLLLRQIPDDSWKKNYKMTIECARNTQIEKWDQHVWKTMFIHFVMNEQLYPKFMKGIIQQHFLTRWEASDARLKNYLLKRLGMSTRKFQIEKRFLTRIKRYKGQKFKNIIQLFAINVKHNHIIGQRIIFPELTLTINNETIKILELSFYLKKCVTWGEWETNKMEIIVKKNKDFVGVIDSESNFSGFYNDEIITFLKNLEKYHLSLCGCIGIVTKRCVFCHHNLSDEFSLLNGYGMTCAKTHGLLKESKKRKTF
jgi:hypothetical protein